MLFNLFKEHEVDVKYFTRDGERKYTFVVKFKNADIPIAPKFVPFLTNSKEAISLLMDPIEFAERIQDKGANYVVTSNVILFNDEESARIAGEELALLVKENLSEQLEWAIYEYNKKYFFGQQRAFLERAAERLEVDIDKVSDEVLNNELEAYASELEKSLV